jgi:hypothetical protein
MAIITEFMEKTGADKPLIRYANPRYCAARRTAQSSSPIFGER